MFAIIETSGKQYMVEQGKTLEVDLTQDKEGSTITLDKVLLISGNGSPKIGAPFIEGAFVTAKVLSHGKGGKVRTLKFIPKKRHSKRRGFRADLTTIEITEIKETGGPKTAPEKEVAEKPEAKPVKEAPAKKVTVKKPAVRRVAKKTEKKAD
ncbi:MAG: 50S ribosomal protein L21 [Patescibacteria group bacterium]